MPRGRGVRRGRRNPYPLRNRQGRGQVQHQEVEPRALEHDVEAREVEHEVEARAVEAPQQHQNMTNTVAVQADNTVINGEDFVNDCTCSYSSTLNNNPLIVPMNNEIDIYVNQNLKDNIWNLAYVNLALLLNQNFDVPSEQKMNALTVLNGNIVVNTENRNLKVRSIDNIEHWTDAFCNFSKIVVQTHPMLAGDLFAYMSLIRGAVSDATFDRVYNYDKQFRLRIEQNPSKSWAQIDGNLWLRFVAKGALGGQTFQYQSDKFCYDYNLKKGCFRNNCFYRHACLKCTGMHPSTLCTTFRSNQPSNTKYLQNSNKKALGRSLSTIHVNNIGQAVPSQRQSFRPPPQIYAQNMR